MERIESETAAALRSGNGEPVTVHPSAPVSAGGLRFDLLRNAACHADRLAFFVGAHRLAMFIAAMSGATAAATAIGSTGQLAAAAGFIVVALTTLDLVFDLSGKAREHATLRDSTFAILAELETAPSDPATITRCEAQLARLFGKESVTRWAVSAMAWNQACCATHRPVDPENLIEVGFLRRSLRHVLSLPGDYLSVRESAGRARESGGMKVASR